MPTSEQHDDMIAAASQAVDAARINLRHAHDRVKSARAKVSTAITAWQSAFPPVTHEENVRRMIAQEQERKQRNVDAGRHPSDDGNREAPQFKSNVDAMAYHSSGGNRGAGGGNAFRRQGNRPNYPRGYILPTKRPGEA